MTFTDDDLKRFWSKVFKTQTCWNWQASNYRGYGQFWNGKRLVAAHRFSYELKFGPISDLLTIDHICRNPSCVNPGHLQTMSNVDNARLGSKAQNMHCPQGHSFDDKNIIWVKDSKGRMSRMCRVCKQAKDRRYHHKNKERINAGKREAWRKSKGE